MGQRGEGVGNPKQLGAELRKMLESHGIPVWRLDVVRDDQAPIGLREVLEAASKVANTVPKVPRVAHRGELPEETNRAPVVPCVREREE